MKKMLMFLSSTVLILVLTVGCCLTAYGEAAVSPSATEAPETPEAEAGSEALIAYFSWSGNTEQVAQMIAEQTGADLFKIEPATPYTDDYNALLDIARQEQADNARPELAAQVENWENYDVIFVGYPNWLAYHKLIQCTQLA